MTTACIITMLSVGIVGSISERVLTSFGKMNEASFVSIATLAGIGVTALGIVIELIAKMATL